MQESLKPGILKKYILEACSDIFCLLELLDITLEVEYGITESC